MLEIFLCTKKFLAALLTGALAIAVANPTYLVKVRLQAVGKFLVGVIRRYYGTLDAYYTIVRHEGLGAMWTGLEPNIARNAIVNAAKLVNFFAVCIGSPIDIYILYW